MDPIMAAIMAVMSNPQVQSTAIDIGGKLLGKKFGLDEEGSGGGSMSPSMTPRSQFMGQPPIGFPSSANRIPYSQIVNQALMNKRGF